MVCVRILGCTLFFLAAVFHSSINSSRKKSSEVRRTHWLARETLESRQALLSLLKHNKYTFSQDQLFVCLFVSVL